MSDLISRQAAIDAVDTGLWGVEWDKALATAMLKDLPSAQPERTCVNCGRTVNNGGWYADGRTRCPIEEHYALPKDGFCHLWEKRNVTDDDYPERREDAVSRQYLIDIATEDGAYDYVSAQQIANAPSVTPQPKTGHWIDDNENEIDAQYGRHLYKCSECNEYADMFVGGTEDWWDIEKPNYCPNCGARMVEPQESERKV